MADSEREMRRFRIPFTLRPELLYEYQEGRGTEFTIKCRNGEINLGKYVLPLASRYFEHLIDMHKNSDSYEKGQTVQISCEEYPLETVKVHFHSVIKSYQEHSFYILNCRK